MTVRSLVKGALERTLIWSGASNVARRRMSGRVLVLAYHNIIPDGSPPSGDLPNHLPLSSFAAQLASLRATHDIVSLTDALIERPNASRPRAVITFDDAYQGAVIHGVGELVRHGLPATIFVAPAFIGGRSFWWDALAAGGPGGLGPDVRNHALEELRGEDVPIRAWANATGLPLGDVPPVACAASEEDLLWSAHQPGITLGSHTWGHPNLTRLDAAELSTEMTTPLEWLRERIANPLPWLAYPYGYFDETVATAASAAGYEGALAVSGGWFPPSPNDPFTLPRINIPPGLSVRGFVLRAAGLLSG